MKRPEMYLEPYTAGKIGIDERERFEKQSLSRRLFCFTFILN